MTDPIHKTFEIKILEKRKDGGRIRINTASVDRDRDRVFPRGANVENYLNNPVVMFGHNYRDFWSTIGKTNKLDISDDAIDADFTLRPAANEHDPQNVILLLWNGEWIRTASIGFIPDAKAAKQNDLGGFDFMAWELLEWSVVPIPSNQDALRLAVKGLDAGVPEGVEAIWANAITRAATDMRLTEVERVAQLDRLQSLRKRFFTETELREAARQGTKDAAWIRTLTVDGGLGEQTLFACFRSYTLDIPEGATVLEANDDGECEEQPHPDAGKSVAMKDCVFVPPLVFDHSEWGEDAVYSVSGKDAEDSEFVKSEEWEVKSLSDIQLALPVAKSAQSRRIAGAPINRLTLRMATRLTRIVKQRKATLRKALEKRGRVLSASNEKKIRDARDNLNEVLDQLEEETEQEGNSPRDEKSLDALLNGNANDNQATSNTTDTPALSDERELAELLEGVFENLKEGLL